MFLFALVLGVLFLPEVNNLQCYECLSNPNKNCNESTVSCHPYETVCVSSTQVEIKDGRVFSVWNLKHCMSSPWCVETSIHYGNYREVRNVTCCKENLCNTRIPDYMSTANGKKCYTCEGENCRKTLNCEGDENYCFTFSGKSPIVLHASYLSSEDQIQTCYSYGNFIFIFSMNVGKDNVTLGCTSKQMCPDPPPSKGDSTYEKMMKCCQGDYCNSVSRVSPALLLLMPLLFSNLLLASFNFYP
ncbi:urokinase plasminogen activator surface receptor-like [Poecilia latipinna]|uniref:urokinase plasminogen activator surface receptor-like n=1 Tax=Poecilia latipinna TaxID=48699 RepID=UPI00072DE89F|nr:PREDICTED: urokinase plasminogen activator surface receptor-like [Poecilia latipinna]